MKKRAARRREKKSDNYTGKYQVPIPKEKQPEVNLFMVDSGRKRSDYLVVIMKIGLVFFSLHRNTPLARSCCPKTAHARNGGKVVEDREMKGLMAYLKVDAGTGDQQHEAQYSLGYKRPPS
ncbi:hypothetical protein MCOR14_004197 [Pyricularia oryzae]|nr:hypothetical protein MCOR34_001486 [Pyricularia oryzae]KAI6471640.1 hypothetical protein MCOR17_003095 [Pyricularia oryzae]KAI6507159.1 hypothetical protein MCOR13_002954 [Pyricularia oryzae]KAI6583046.1 hypothetical protein MCOR04_005139 [Pyricularia oryzae]KAI6638822.1 hypothetical protein MCOR14_004197 [Pyricularia oryzae]